MYSLSFLFLTLPLYFSHIFMHFGIVIGDGASFERQKMGFFGILLIIATLEIMMTRWGTFWENLQKYGYLIIGLLGWPFIATWIYDTPIDTYWLRGSYEKFHGYLLYFGIIWLGLLITHLTQKERKKLLSLNLIPATIISIIAALEWVGLSLFLTPKLNAWGEGIRAIATLGNPNYLAGYLLLSLPIVAFARKGLHPILSILIFLALITTGSYIGIGLATLYIFIELTRLMITEWQHRQRQIFWSILGLIILAGMGTGISLLDETKFLSLESRFILMGEILKNLVAHPLGFITGYGPESILRFFEAGRSTIIDNYFPKGSLIDSSHNILLDIIFQYGIVPLIFVGYFMRKYPKDWNPYARDAWFLGVAFLMMNPYVVVHLSLLTLTFLTHDRSHSK